MQVEVAVILPATVPAHHGDVVDAAEPITKDSVIRWLPMIGTLTLIATVLSRCTTAAAMADRSCASSAAALAPVVAEVRKSVRAKLTASVTAALRSSPRR